MGRVLILRTTFCPRARTEFHEKDFKYYGREFSGD
jgi:hypothetical protein